MKSNYFYLSPEKVPVTLEIEMAETRWQRFRGLLGRDTLAANRGLWIPHCQGIHTFGMRFAIDALYLDKRGGIRKIVRQLPPHRFGPVDFGTDAVLELASGNAERLGFEPGEILILSQGLKCADGLWRGSGQIRNAAGDCQG